MQSQSIAENPYRLNKLRLLAPVARAQINIQRAHSMTDVIAEEVEDISGMLDVLVREEGGSVYR